jgi:hypothetical protein
VAGLSFKVETRPDLQTLANNAAQAETAVDRQLRNIMLRMRRRMEQFAYAEAPKDTGKYSRRITSRDISGGNVAGFEMLSPHPLSRFIQQGTRPHTIVPRRARMLRFYWPRVGRVVFARRVNHPGTKPNQFYQRALIRWRPEAMGELRQIPGQWVATLRGGR